MSFEHERLPRSVELAANIVAGHVRRTETAPERFADLLMAAYQGIKALENADRNPGTVSAIGGVRRQAGAKPQLVAADGSTDGELPLLSAPVEAPPAAPKYSSKDLQQTSSKEDIEQGYVRDGRQTVFNDRIICLDDGREVTFLRRHLRRQGIDEVDYLARHNLPRDYPMTTPAYVEAKKEAAAKSGFGKELRPAREKKVEETPAAKGKKKTAAAPAVSPAARKSTAKSAPRRPGTLRPSF
jgi:predicted transcriptional regulator